MKRIEKIFFHFVLIGVFVLSTNLLSWADETGVVSDTITKLLTIFCFLYSVYNYKRIFEHNKKIFLALILGVVYLILKSLVYYGTPVVYPSVISRVLILFVPLAVIEIYRKGNGITLQKLMNIYAIFFFIKLFLAGTIFKLGYGSDERINSADEAYIMYFIFLYYFNMYFFNRRLKDILFAVIALVFVILFQHRTIWSLFVIVLLINTFYVVKYKIYQFTFLFKASFAIATIIAIIIFSFYQNSKLNDTLKEDLGDITNITEQGTGAWRLLQAGLYMDKFTEKPILGWDYQAFAIGELLSLEVGDGSETDTGTHIHIQYVDILYYTGLVGLAAFLYIILRTISLLWRKKNKTVESVTLLFFVFSSIIFSFSYRVEIFNWAIIGIGWYIAISKEPFKNHKHKQINT